LIELEGDDSEEVGLYEIDQDGLIVRKEVKKK
jgi:hypothetical protein